MRRGGVIVAAPAVSPDKPPRWLTPRMRELIQIIDTWPNDRDGAVAMIALTELLPAEDSEPMESPFHLFNIGLLVGQLAYRWPNRHDYFAGGNMFLYYSPTRVLKEDFRGPDFFFVSGVNGRLRREKWVVWNEHRFPEVIIEFNSPSTAHIDLHEKKDLYEQVFRTREYYCFDHQERRLIGWHLKDWRYTEQPPNPQGWLWSEVLQAWLGPWEGTYLTLTGT